jgi:hypothetical protein
MAASICAGFVLYFTVSIFTVFIRGHRAFADIAQTAGLLGMVAYLAMMLWWINVVMSPAPVFEKAMKDQLSLVFNEFEVARKTAARAAIMSQS